MTRSCPAPIHPGAGACFAPPRTKVLCFIPRLGAGGAEMHLLRLLNHFERDEFEPVLAVVRRGGSYETRLREDVVATACGWETLPSATLRMQTAIPRLRGLLQREQPAVVMAFLDHSVSAMAQAMAGLAGPAPLFLAGIQNNLAMTLEHLPRWARGWLGRNILAAYARADRVIALSTGVAETLVQLVPSARERVTVIHNAGYDREAETLSREAPSLATPRGNWFLGCGRLTRQKDFVTLLRAFGRIKNDTEGELWILGEGELRATLESEIAALGLSGRVRLPGFVKNPFAFMARASAFVLSSRWEGFGNVVTEAMACGTPVIATDCPHGPREILEDGKWGELVPVGNVDALAEAMRASVRDSDHFRARAEAARGQVARFEATPITRQYESAIREALSAAAGRVAA